MAKIKNCNQYLAACDDKSLDLENIVDAANDKLDNLNAQLRQICTSVKAVAEYISEDLDITNPEEFAWFDDISDAEAERCYDAWSILVELSSQCSNLLRHINEVVDQLDHIEI